MTCPRTPAPPAPVLAKPFPIFATIAVLLMSPTLHASPLPSRTQRWQRICLHAPYPKTHTFKEEDDPTTYACLKVEGYFDTGHPPHPDTVNAICSQLQALGHP